ncbi:UNVERIFIED_CONTAM: hypothetical protein Scaly_2881000 [Sesamum calycinum]|uniref:Uncharacterized protein n=1 Tax=Sesamum calycinum TaxID=2727403 RepID=A0AAW2L7I1_9LAMI
MTVGLADIGTFSIGQRATSGASDAMGADNGCRTPRSQAIEGQAVGRGKYVGFSIFPARHHLFHLASGRTRNCPVVEFWDTVPLHCPFHYTQPPKWSRDLAIFTGLGRNNKISDPRVGGAGALASVASSPSASRCDIETPFNISVTHSVPIKVNNPTLSEFCFTMIARANIQGPKSNIAMKASLPQASYPYDNFSDTSSFKFRRNYKAVGIWSFAFKDDFVAVPPKAINHACQSEMPRFVLHRGASLPFLEPLYCTEKG